MYSNMLVNCSVWHD